MKKIIKIDKSEIGDLTKIKSVDVNIFEDYVEVNFELN